MDKHNSSDGNIRFCCNMVHLVISEIKSALWAKTVDVEWKENSTHTRLSLFAWVEGSTMTSAD